MNNQNHDRRSTRVFLLVASFFFAPLLTGCGAQEQPNVPEKTQGDEGPELKAQRERSAVEADIGASLRATDASENPGDKST